MAQNSKLALDLKHFLCIILTGMGKDGAQGMLEMKKAGAINIAQD